MLSDLSCFAPKMFKQMFPNIPHWYRMAYHTVIRSTISGYPPPVREAQLKFIGRSSFCFSVKGIRFKPPEYEYQLRHPEIVLVECKPEEM